MQAIFWWTAFFLFLFTLLAIDLIVFNRKPHEIKIRESLVWSAAWITISLLFNVAVYFWYGHEAALQFFTGYLIEKSLSVDNLFVFLLIFTFFKVPAKYQHKVLFWGILGALVMRGSMIGLGAALIRRFHWILYLFGMFLVVTGARMFFSEESTEVHPERNIFIKFFRKYFRVAPDYHEGRLFVRIDGKRYATLLVVVMIVIETTDLAFAVDSIPAIFAITTNSFIVFTSNIFAILGLRSLYFTLAGMLEVFHYLRYGVAIVLAFVGAKMLIEPVFSMGIGIALTVVVSVLVVSVILSLLKAKRDHGVFFPVHDQIPPAENGKG
jgi:tellurite resistance protein TerC